MPKKKPWYSNGLRFECQRCSQCCRGEPGHVWVSDSEVEHMARHLALAPEEFIRAYVRSVGSRRSLKELPGGDCVLWAGPERACLVYPVRPVQCRTFPFWDTHLHSSETWSELAQLCPCINNGRLYSPKEIEKRLATKEH